MRQLPEIEAYYRDLFTRDPNRSMRYPTRNECTRLGKICEYLSEIAWRRGNPAELEARILDLGCGRGWLTPLLAVYGASEGIDPIAAVIEQARRHHPATKFRVGTAHDVLRDPAFRPYDVVIVSEVIEHVPYAQQDYFMQEIRALIAPNGFAIITTPRREWIAEWQRAGLIWQPVEDWLTDSELQTLFTRNGFTLIRHDHLYTIRPAMSRTHRLCAAPLFTRLTRAIKIEWLSVGLRSSAAVHQAGLFQLN